MYKEILGLVAGLLTTIAFLPQLIKIYQSRSAKDISLIMYIVYSMRVLAWLIYGILEKDLPLIVSNGLGLILAVSVLILKIAFDRKIKRSLINDLASNQIHVIST